MRTITNHPLSFDSAKLPDPRDHVEQLFLYTADLIIRNRRAGIPAGFSNLIKFTSQGRHGPIPEDGPTGIPFLNLSHVGQTCQGCGVTTFLDFSHAITDRFGIYYDGLPISMTFLNSGMQSCCLDTPSGAIIFINKAEAAQYANEIGLNPAEMELAVVHHELGHAVSFARRETSCEEIVEEFNACMHAKMTVPDALPYSWRGVSPEVQEAAMFLSLRSRQAPDEVNEVIKRGFLRKFMVSSNGLIKSDRDFPEFKFYLP